jgi:hypothetical protein
MIEEKDVIIETLDRIIETSNRIDEKLNQILDLVEDREIKTSKKKED